MSIHKPGERFSAILFTTGIDEPKIVTVIAAFLSRKGGPTSVSLQLAFITSEATYVSIQRKILDHFPASRGIPFHRAYSIIYWVQDSKMPLNKSVFVQGSMNEFEMTVGRRCACRSCSRQVSEDDWSLFSAVADGIFDCVEEEELEANVFEV
ncbi:hypothetical protein EV363DRAFT_1445861 [Boletus edulis]|nr:hypothetical protein EV363DRAFT_1445861 [Boletus edulis]